MRTKLSCARRVLSLSVAAALGAPLVAASMTNRRIFALGVSSALLAASWHSSATPIVADGVHLNISDVTAEADDIASSNGLTAIGGGSIRASNVKAIGGNAPFSSGVLSSGAGSLVEFNAGSIESLGLGSAALSVRSGGEASIRKTSITSFGNEAMGIRGSAGGALINLSDVDVSTFGDQSHALMGFAGTHVTATATSFTTSGRLSDGVQLQGDTSLNGIGLDIRTTGDSSRGAVAAESMSLLALTDSNVVTEGDSSHGVRARDGARLALDGTQVTTTGAGSKGADLEGGNATFHASVINSAATGVHAYAGATAGLTQTHVETTGDLADSLHVQSGSTAKAEQVELVTHGGMAHGINTDAATISAAYVSISTAGSESNGLLGTNGATMTLGNVSIRTAGERSHGIASNSGSQLALDGAIVETLGEAAVGVIVRDVGSHADLSNLQILTHGKNSIGVVVDHGPSSAILANSQIVTEGIDSNAARVQDGATLEISNSVLKSEAASALLLNNGTLTATDGTAIEGNGTLAEFGSDAANTLSFDRDVVALGDIRFDAGALDTDGNGVLDRTSSLSLDNNSYWKGATDAIGDLSMANGSRWDVTGNSQVGSLSLANSSVVFDHADGQYKTLTVDGNFHADNGLLAMNTALGDDTSPTDLLHVKGDTSGNANIAVNNIGGTGAQTEEGIKLVQVDGVSAGEYALAGRAVGGAYEYFLYQGGHTDPSDGDWYLRSELSKVDPPVVPPVTPCVGADCPVDPVIDPPKPTPVFRPEAGAYLANQASVLGLFNMDLHERVGEPNLAQRQRGDGSLGSAWARVTTEQPRYRVNDQLTGQGRQNVVQIGSDLTFWGKQDRGVVGIMAGSGQATNRVTSSLTGYGAEGRVDGKSLGVYSTWIQDAEDDDGLYIDGWLQAAQFKNRVQGDALAREQYRSRSLSASVEAGYALRLHQNETSALYLEPQVQAIWTDYRMDGGQHQEVNGSVVKTADAGGLQTRVGARLYGHSTAASGNRVQPFVGVNWIRNGSDANAVWMGEQRLQGIVPKDVYEAKVGAQLQLSPNLTGWGEVSVQQGDYGFRSVGGQLGVKYAW